MNTNSIRRLLVLYALLLAVAGCGGGSSADDEDLPQTLALPSAEAPHAVGKPIAFDVSLGAAARNLDYEWNFGDGASSRQAAPTHSFKAPGIYDVTLSLRQDDEIVRKARWSVTMADFDVVGAAECRSSDKTGWCWQNPLPQGNTMRDIEPVDATVAWAVGDLGTVLRTDDAGRTWTLLNSTTTVDLADVAAVDAQTAWVAGANGVVLRTLDGGASWSVDRLEQSTGFYEAEIGASSALEAWRQSATGLQATRDGGNSWQAIADPEDLSVSTRVVIDARTVWASAVFGSHLHRTTDGGATWRQIALPPPPEAERTREVREFDAASATLAWVLVDDNGVDADSNYLSTQRMLITHDGGAHWTPMPGSAAARYRYRFSDADHGVRWSSELDRLQITSNAGQRWRNLRVPAGFDPSFDLAALELRGNSLVTLRVNSGEPRLSFDAGRHWSAYPNGRSQPDLVDIRFFDLKDGLAISSGQQLLRTADGGTTWKPEDLGAVQLSRLEFLPGGAVGWVAANGNTLYRTTDHGVTWTVPLNAGAFVPDNLSGFHFIDADQGWLVRSGTSSDTSSIYRSSDGGSNWTAVAGTPWALQAIAFANAQDGIAVGDSGFIVTTHDGGATWSTRPPAVDGTLSRVRWLDAETAVAIASDGRVVRSTDKGESWTLVRGASNGGLNDVVFVSPLRGHAVGGEGRVISTVDGGLTWRDQSSGTTRTLRAVYFANAATAWIAGESGTVLATATGGW